MQEVHQACVCRKNGSDDCRCPCKLRMLPKQLSFFGCDWTAKHMSELVQALPSFSKVTNLDLQDNKLGDEAMKMLAPALEASQCFCASRTGILAAISLLVKMVRPFFSSVAAHCCWACADETGTG